MIYYLHWVIERLLTSGEWVATHSNIRLEDLRDRAVPDRPAYGASFQMSQRDYPLYRKMSGIDEPDDYIPIALPGLPKDASIYTRDYLEGDQRAIQESPTMDPPYLIAHGHIPWSYFEAALRKAQDSESGYIPLYSKARLIETMTPILGREILFGSVRIKSDPHHPDMVDISNHVRLDLEHKLSQITPISGDTMRLCIAYRAC
jgi:hypothetical protein